MSRKRMLFLSCLLVFGIIATGCSGVSKEEGVFAHETSEGLQNSIVATTEKIINKETEEVLPSIAINYEALEVDYSGEAPIYDVCNYRDKIYFTCELEGEYAGIYEMTAGEDSSSAVLTDLTDGLVPKVITAGTDGSLYTVLKSNDEEGKLQQMLLWKLDSKGNVIFEEDITKLVPKESTPWAVAVDAAGYIFVRIGIMREELFLVFDEEGNYSGAIKNSGNFQHIDALGRAQDGYVYAILGTQDATNILAKCDGVTCTIEEYSLGPMASGAGLFAVVGTGFGSDLTLYGPGYGLCKYDMEEDATVYLAPGDFPYAVDGMKGCILEDGRYLMVKKAEKSKQKLNYEVGTVVDLRGNIVATFDGSGNNVEIPIELLKDAIFTHNHPAGGCFSAADIGSMIASGLYELRASTPDGSFYSLKRGENTILNEEIVKSYKAATSKKKASEAIRYDIQRGVLSREEVTERIEEFSIEYRSRLGEDWLDNNAHRCGLIYRKGAHDE